MNKKGQVADQMMFFVLLIAMLIIGGALAGGVVLFYGSEIEARGAMAEVLNYKLRKCVIENEIDILEEDNLLEKCKLNQEVLEGFVDIKICEDIEIMSECADEKNSIYQFGSNFVQCGFKEKSKEFPICNFNTFEYNGKIYGILTAYNQFSNKVLG